MGLFSKEFNSLDDLFLEQIKDLYDAENRLCDALPKMADAAENPQLQAAFRSHLKETQTQLKRLETVFQKLGKDAERETCDAMKGLVSEGDEAISAKADGPIKDAALIAAAQRVEHYEMAGYGTARTFAERLGHTEIARLLEQTLDEEKAADKKLTSIANEAVNPASARV